MLDVLAHLPLHIEHVSLGRLARSSAAGGIRRTTLVRLRGNGQEGLGEDVTFQVADALATASALTVLSGVGTLAEAWDRLDRLELFDRPPEHAVVRNYRRWAVEAAALDLALLQTGLSLGERLGRAPQPVSFVVSPTRSRLRRFPDARLKVDAEDVEPGLPVDVIDFKGRGDAPLVSRALDLYPEALLEDPPVVEAGARVCWDIGIHSLEDVLRLSEPPAAVNVKPARLGSVATLLDLYAGCAREGIALYGGGQHELGPGRAQIQLLAALFHPDGPNDVAPDAYNDAEPPPGLPASPLEVSSHPGFR